MPKINNNVSFAGISHSQIAISDALLDRDLCRNVIRKFPNEDFDKVFNRALKTSKKDLNPILVFENPFYLSMIEKLKNAKPKQLCQEWMKRHIEIKYDVDINKAIDVYSIDGQDKKDYIRHFRAFWERQFQGVDFLEKISCQLEQLSGKDKVDSEIESLLDNNDYYQNSFSRFLEPKGFKINDPYHHEKPFTFREVLGIDRHIE